MKITISYTCEICGNSYDTEEKARVCESRGTEKACVEVGDIVTCRAAFGWFDGDSQWISNPQVAEGGVPKPGGVSIGIGQPGHGNCFGPCCTYSFFYVVTAIDHEKHRVRYHLFTEAMSGRQGYRCGYTYSDGHRMPERVSSPPAHVVESARALIGQKATHLL